MIESQTYSLFYIESDPITNAFSSCDRKLHDENGRLLVES